MKRRLTDKFGDKYYRWGIGEWTPIVQKLGFIEDKMQEHEIIDEEHLARVLNDYERKLNFFYQINAYLEQKGLYDDFKEWQANEIH